MAKLDVLPPEPFWRELVIVVSGELDTDDVGRIDALLVSALAGSDAVTLDLASVTLAGPAAVDGLVGSRREWGAPGLALSVRSPAPSVERALRLAGWAFDADARATPTRSEVRAMDSVSGPGLPDPAPGPSGACRPRGPRPGAGRW